jgi:hypothetical protein
MKDPATRYQQGKTNHSSVTGFGEVQGGPIIYRASIGCLVLTEPGQDHDQAEYANFG